MHPEALAEVACPTPLLQSSQLVDAGYQRAQARKLGAQGAMPSRSSCRYCNRTPVFRQRHSNINMSHSVLSKHAHSRCAIFLRLALDALSSVRDHSPKMCCRDAKSLGNCKFSAGSRFQRASDVPSAAPSTDSLVIIAVRQLPFLIRLPSARL